MTEKKVKTNNRLYYKKFDEYVYFVSKICYNKNILIRGRKRYVKQAIKYYNRINKYKINYI